MIELVSSRLRMIALDAPSLVSMSFGRAALERHLGLEPHGWQLEEWVEIEIADAMHFWSRNAREHPEHYPWATTWEIVLLPHNVSVGGMGFGGPPDELGYVQVGYSLDLRYRGQGIATEALQLLMNWAFGQPGVKAIYADTPKDNLPSQQVLIRSGFALKGETDEGNLRWSFPKP